MTPHQSIWQDRIPGLVTAVRQWCGDRLFFLLACFAGAGCLIAVPQVTRLISQPPTRRLDLLLFVALLVFLAVLYLVTLIDLVRPFRGTGITAWVKFINGWVLMTAEAMKSQSVGMRGWVFPVAMVGAGLWMTVAVPFSFAIPYPLAGAAIRMFGMWIAMTGAFLLYGKYIGPDRVIAWSAETRQWRQRRASDAPDVMSNASQRGTSPIDQSTTEARSGWDLLGAVLSWLFVTTLIGEVLWGTAVLEIRYASLRLYTIWAVVHVLVTAAVFGGVIDFFHRFSILPARTFALALIFLAAWFQSGEVIRDAPAPLPLSAMPIVEAEQPKAGDDPAPGTEDQDEHRLGPPSADPWLRHMQVRLEEMPEGPVVLIAASGGGSRAAMFTALVLDLFKSEPMRLPAIEPLTVTSVVGADATATADKNSQPGQESMWSEHVLMISSVSGGSIATARYVEAASARSEKSDRTALQHTDREELISRTANQINVWLDLDKNPSSATSIRLRRVRDLVHQVDRKPPNAAPPVAAKPAVENTADASKPAVLGQLTEDDQKRLRKVAEMAFSSRFADDMCADFMAPLLRGFLSPWSSRGDGLFHFWESEFGWADIRLNRRLSETEMDARPLVLFNTTDVDSGRRVVMGYPSLPAEMWRPRPPATNRSQRVSGLMNEGRYAPMSAAMFEGGSLDDMPLARAVRLSSNFPFGFPVAEVRVRQPAPDPDPKAEAKAALPERYRFLDGGVVDNTGIDSLHAVFSDLHRSAVDDPTGEVARVLAEIRRRGVVFVEIDSGAKPSASADASSPFASIGRPLSALNNATYTNALRSSDYFTRDLGRILSHWMPAVLLKTEKALKVGTIPFSYNSLKLDVESKSLAWAVPAITAEYASELDTSSVLSIQFVCNHISRSESHVMTALALGPQDKAAIIAQFLDQCHEWRGATPNRKVFFDEKQKLAADFVNEGGSQEASLLAIRDLLRTAEKEMEEALRLLTRISADEWTTGEPSAEQLEAIRPIVMRPYVLLMGVRVLADAGSVEFQTKGADLKRLNEGITALIEKARSRGAAVRSNTGASVSLTDFESQSVENSNYAALHEEIKTLESSNSHMLMQKLGQTRQLSADIQQNLDVSQASNRSFYDNVGKVPVDFVKGPIAEE